MRLDVLPNPRTNLRDEFKTVHEQQYTALKVCCDYSGLMTPRRLKKSLSAYFAGRASKS
jgi:hypothetical protein